MSFDRHFKDSAYLQLKNNLFNYLMRKRAIQKHLLEVPKNHLILDVGSGVSPVTLHPQQTVFLEISLEGAKHLVQQGHRTVVGDVQGLGFSKERFNIVICSEVLEHIEKDRLALMEIYRVLRPGGALIITAPVHSYYWGKDDEFVGHHRRYDPEVLGAMLEDAGYTIVKISKVTGPLERLSTWGVTLAFSMLGGRTKGIRALPGWLIAVYGFTNRMYALALQIDAKLWPRALTSVMLVACKK
jgi:SAM-dependent methyltransferase